MVTFLGDSKNKEFTDVTLVTDDHKQIKTSVLHPSTPNFQPTGRPVSSINLALTSSLQEELCPPSIWPLIPAYRRRSVFSSAEARVTLVKSEIVIPNDSITQTDHQKEME